MTANAYIAELAFAVRTDTGKVRKRNEDAIGVSPSQGIAVLADGMGGYNAGDVASGIAVATVMEIIEKRLAHDTDGRAHGSQSIRHLLEEAIEEANRAIHETALKDKDCSGMGTTLVVAVFHHDKLVVAHLGDSRLYRWRAGMFEALTRDHSLMQAQIDAGLVSAEEARHSPNRNLITRALGVEESVEPEIHEHVAMPGDLYLLCSDGLSDMLSDEDIAGLIAHCRTDIDAACDTLIRQANTNGGHDNVSAILVSVKSVRPEPPNMLDRLLGWAR